MSYTPRLKERYKGEIAKALQSTFGFKSSMRVPRLKKIVLSQGLGEAVADKKIIDSAMGDMAKITGQHPVAKLSKKDISNFKLRKGMPVGVMVTLRGDKMYEFLDRFINIALPRTRDFRGISPKGFDGRGNFNMGIKEHIIFPEIDIDQVNKILGMDITFVTSAGSDKEGQALLNAFDFPFIKDERAAERAASEAKKAAMKKEREDAVAALKEDAEGGEEGATSIGENLVADETNGKKETESNEETESTE